MTHEPPRADHQHRRHRRRVRRCWSTRPGIRTNWPGSPPISPRPGSASPPASPPTPTTITCCGTRARRRAALGLRRGRPARGRSTSRAGGGARTGLAGGLADLVGDSTPVDGRQLPWPGSQTSMLITHDAHAPATPRSGCRRRGADRRRHAQRCRAAAAGGVHPGRLRRPAWHALRPFVEPGGGGHPRARLAGGRRGSDRPVGGRPALPGPRCIAAHRAATTRLGLPGMARGARAQSIPGSQ